MRPDNWLSQLPDSWLECRAMRHSWKLSGFLAVNRDDKKILGSRNPMFHKFPQVVVRATFCDRCEVIRTDYYGRTDVNKVHGFVKITSHYRYPKGYLFHKTEESADRPQPVDAVFETFMRSGGAIPLA